MIREEPKFICGCTVVETMTSGLYKIEAKKCDTHHIARVANYFEELKIWKRLGELKALDVFWTCMKDVIYYFRGEIPVTGDHVAVELLDQLETRLNTIEPYVSPGLKMIIKIGKEQEKKDNKNRR